MNVIIRQTHRWISLLFVIVVAAIFAMLGTGHQPAQWIYLIPLAPLAILALTGIYLFVLPYAMRSRSNG